MSNQPDVGLQSQLPTRNEIVDLAEGTLVNVAGSGLIRSAGSGIAKGAEFVAERAKSVKHSVEKGAKATWEFIY